MFEHIDALFVIGKELQILIGKGQLELLEIHLDQLAFVQDFILYRKTWLAIRIRNVGHDSRVLKSLRKACSSSTSTGLQDCSLPSGLLGNQVVASLSIPLQEACHSFRASRTFP